MGTNTSPSAGGEVMLVGCMPDADGRGRGIHAFGADGSELGRTAVTDPRYLAVHPRLPVVYALSERDPTRVAAFRQDPDGTLALLNDVGTGGSGGCHLRVDASEQVLLVGHYSVGSVSAIALHPDGRLKELTSTIEFTGSGPETERQGASHAHQVVQAADGTLLVPDLGSDLVRRLRLSPAGDLTELDPIVTPPGLGPRHLVQVTDDLLVVAGELSATLWPVRRDGAHWHGLDQVPVSTSDRVRSPDGRTYPSAIVTVADRVIVANRGADTFTEFAVDPRSGTLTRRSETPTGGAWPRDLTWHRDRVWVANEHAGGVTEFARDGDGWQQLNRLPCAGPACIVFSTVPG